ncbi:MAG: S26 family signal peptidase [Pirellulaceae bacterium]
MSKTKSSAAPLRAPRTSRGEAAAHVPPNQATRETVESIALAVILAFLFRAFVAEAFVIPTGSMAPTLMGQHKDVQCPECDYWYQAGASIEIDDDANDQRFLEAGRQPPKSAVVATTCPICRYRLLLDWRSNANQKTFSGDRILVSKFVYDFTLPERWDVIVFKYPFNAKQNFIKRLVGLPNEEILLRLGDVFVKQPDETQFSIVRKPDHKLKAMLQLVDDTRHISKTLTEIGWPLRWQSWTPAGQDASSAWSTNDQGHTYLTEGRPGEDLWLRYHHIIPSDYDWQLIDDGQTPPMLANRPGELLTDFYPYNAFTSIDRQYLKGYDPGRKPEEYARPMFGSASLHPFGTLGWHWVSDVALEGDIDVQSDQGELLCLLVKGGVNYKCRIDIATGRATLSINEGAVSFVGSDGTSTEAPVGQTSIEGRGTYRLRFSNVDAEVRLWVNDSRVEFDGATTYLPQELLRPTTSAEDPGDLAPLGIGTQGAALHVQRLRVLRDVYYVSTQGHVAHEYKIPLGEQKIREILHDPQSWPDTKLFASQDQFQMALGDNQLFPLGDNSPQSSDARMWQEHFVDRDLLIGKALLIYWPHPWYRPIPYLPNFKRMRLIR